MPNSIRVCHDVLIPIAEAAYLPNLQSGSLPPGYEAVGPIRVNERAAAAQIVQARLPRLSPTSRDGATYAPGRQRVRLGGAEYRATYFGDQLSWHGFTCGLVARFRLPARSLRTGGELWHGAQRLSGGLRSGAESMLEQVRSADQKFTRLIVTGHSLGAALCEVATPDLLHNGNVALVPEVQNFAGPRCGHHDFENSFDAEINACFRVVNAWDIVPQLPPR